MRRDSEDGSKVWKTTWFEPESVNLENFNDLCSTECKRNGSNNEGRDELKQFKVNRKFILKFIDDEVFRRR